jgi:hypothetical protein
MLTDVSKPVARWEDSPVGLRDHHLLPGRSVCRPPRSRRTGRSATSREVSRFASLRRSLAAPFRLEGIRPPDHPAAALVRASRAVDAHVGITVFANSPLRFLAPRVSGAFVEWSWRRRPRGSFVAAFPSAHVPGPRFGLLSRPGRDPFGSRRRPWGSLWPFAVFIRPAVDRRLVDVGRTHLPFRRRAVREFFSREVRPLRRDRRARADAAPGFWSRGRAVPRVPPVPPRLLRTGPDEHDGAGLPWALRLSRVSVGGLCASTSGGG